MSAAIVVLAWLVAQPVAPVVIAPSPAEYPAGATGDAVVELELHVSRTGTVTSVTVLGSGGAPFDRAAAEAAAKLLFHPATIDGAPSAAILRLRTRFTVPPPEIARELEPPIALLPAIEVTAEARRRGRAFESTVEEARALPGTQGDPVKALETLPGVSRPPLGADAFSVWGAAPGETRTIVDGVEIPFLFHLGGLRSIVPPDRVARLALTPAGQGAAFGRGIGGLVEIDTRPPSPSPSAAEATLAADLLDVSGGAAVPLADRAAVAATARQSVVQALGDDRLILPLPCYRDLSLSAALDLQDGAELDVLAVAAADGLDRALPGGDPERRRRETVDREAVWARARWSRRHGGGLDRIVPSVVWSSHARAIERGDVAASEARRELRIGLRADRHRTITDAITLRGGIDVLAVTGSIDRLGSLTIPAREGDPALFGRTPGDAVNGDRWSAVTVDVAPHLSAEIELGPLAVTPGLRLDLYGLAVSRTTPRAGETPAIGGARLIPSFEPRLAARVQIVDDVLDADLAVGLYAQPPEPESSSAVFGNPSLALSRGAHGTAGLTWRPWGPVAIDVSGFVRRADRLAARIAEASPRLAEVLTDLGEGRAAGGQVVLRAAADRGPFGWISYTASRAERRAEPGLDWRRADFDRAHQLTAIAGFRAERWSASARVRWSSGAPITAVTGRYYDARRDLIVPVLGPINGDQLPASFQLDLRGERRFTAGPLELALSLELHNVTAHPNVEALAYDLDYRATEPVPGLPFLAIAGVRAEL